METKLDNNKRNPFARKLSFPLGGGELRIVAVNLGGSTAQGQG